MMRRRRINAGNGLVGVVTLSFWGGWSVIAGFLGWVDLDLVVNRTGGGFFCSLGWGFGVADGGG